MKVTMILEDDEGGRPVFSELVEGEDPDQTSMSYSIAVVLKMVMQLLNTASRRALVTFIASLYRAHRDGTLDSAEVSFGEDDKPVCH